MTSRVSPKQCSLRRAVGERELCSGSVCAYWEGGGSIVDNLDLDLTCWLEALPDV